MDILTALKKPRTVNELRKATGLSRGGVIQALRRNKKLVKKAGSKREQERGPESTLYTLRKGVKAAGRKTSGAARRAQKKAATVETPATEAQAALNEVAEVRPELTTVPAEIIPEAAAAVLPPPPAEFVQALEAVAPANVDANGSEVEPGPSGVVGEPT